MFWLVISTIVEILFIFPIIKMIVTQLEGILKRRNFVFTASVQSPAPGPTLNPSIGNLSNLLLIVLVTLDTMVYCNYN